MGVAVAAESGASRTDGALTVMMMGLYGRGRAAPRASKERIEVAGRSGIMYQSGGGFKINISIRSDRGELF